MAISIGAWLNLDIEEELSCKREIGNADDTHALAMRNIIDEDIKTFGRVHAKYLPATDMRGSIFNRRGSYSSILRIVKGNCRCSSNLPQHRWASIFLVRRIYYLCSNPTNQTQFAFQRVTARALK